MEIEFFLCEFENQIHMIFLEPTSNAKQKVIEDFEIELLDGEDLIFKDEARQAVIHPSDIHKFIQIGRTRNMELKILCERKTDREPFLNVQASDPQHCFINRRSRIFR
ncbi:hypothetical protein ACFFRR_007547 [Megaselia abdita]